MRETQWIEWARTRLPHQERDDLVTALTSQQKAHLREHDYVWVEGVGVLWNPPDGDPLRRARFTHGTHFQTQRGEFYIDSEGSAREFSDHRIDPPTPSARPPRLPGKPLTGVLFSKYAGTEIQLEGDEHLRPRLGRR